MDIVNVCAYSSLIIFCINLVGYSEMCYSNIETAQDGTVDIHILCGLFTVFSKQKERRRNSEIGTYSETCHRRLPAHAKCTGVLDAIPLPILLFSPSSHTLYLSRFTHILYYTFICFFHTSYLYV